MNNQYEFDVIAIDCHSATFIDELKKISKPAKVTIKLIQSCKPMIIGTKDYSTFNIG